MSDHAKIFYEVSQKITTEKVQAKRGQISLSQWLTALYLKRLHNAPDASPDGIKRYR